MQSRTCEFKWAPLSDAELTSPYLHSLPRFYVTSADPSQNKLINGELRLDTETEKAH
jgi:hypothetical protein